MPYCQNLLVSSIINCPHHAQLSSPSAIINHRLFLPCPIVITFWYYHHPLLRLAHCYHHLVIPIYYHNLFSGLLPIVINSLITHYDTMTLKDRDTTFMISVYFSICFIQSVNINSIVLKLYLKWSIILDIVTSSTIEMLSVNVLSSSLIRYKSETKFNLQWWKCQCWPKISTLNKLTWAFDNWVAQSLSF